MTDTTYIYGLFDPRNDGLRYVGKSNAPKYRLYKHILDKSICHRTTWISQLKKLNLLPYMKILHEVPKDSWQMWEMAWITSARLQGIDLTNNTDGGVGIPGYKHSQKTIEKFRSNNIGRVAWNKGIPWPDSMRERIRETTKKLWTNPEYRDRLSEAHKHISDEHKVALIKANAGNTYRLGKKFSPETIEKLIQSHKGKTPSLESRLKMSESRKRYVALKKIDKDK